jgi:transposase
MCPGQRHPGRQVPGRKLLIQERTRHANRLHEVLEDTSITLTSVATRLLGASGRAMLDALVAGTTDPAILADLARTWRTRSRRIDLGIARREQIRTP